MGLAEDAFVLYDGFVTWHAGPPDGYNMRGLMPLPLVAAFQLLRAKSTVVRVGVLRCRLDLR